MGVSRRSPPAPSPENSAGASLRLASAALIFAVATVVLTYPLAFHPASLSRLDNGDARLNAWAISWVSYQLTHDPFRLFEANTFYPLPHSLAYSEHLTVQGILALPLLLLTDDLVLTNNLILLFSIFASALGMYWLAHALTGSHRAALLAGLFFAFAPFRFNRLPHIQVQLYAFIPLFLACWHQFIETRRRIWLLPMSALFILQALSGTYLGAIAAVALAVAIVTLLPFMSPSRREVGAVALALLAAGLALLPFALPYLWVNRELGIEWDFDGLQSLSATPRAYLSSSSHLYRDLSESLLPREKSTDFLFPGLTLVVLGGVGFARLLVARQRRRFALCYGLVLAAGVVLSLGPATPVHPFLYENVIFFRGLRALTRFGLLPLLSLSIFSAFGLAWLFGGSQPVSRRNWITLAIAGFFVLESTALPYRLEPFRDEPPEVYEWLSDQKPGPMVELPFKVVDTRYMFWARHHNFRPMLNGDSGFVPMSHQWMKIAFNRFPSDDSLELLVRLRVRYVVLHLGAFRKPALLRLLQGIESHRERLLPVRDFGQDLVFEVLYDSSEDELTPEPRVVAAEGSEPRLFDEDTDRVWASDARETEIEVTLAEPTTVSGFRFHYGPIPRVPVAEVEVTADRDVGVEPLRSFPKPWPAVTELVMGLLATPLDGTQTFTMEPMVMDRFRLRLRGYDGEPLQMTEIEVLSGKDALQVESTLTRGRSAPELASASAPN